MNGSAAVPIPIPFRNSEALVSKFGTLSRAWRLGLDVDGSGKMDMREFCEVGFSSMSSL